MLLQSIKSVWRWKRKMMAETQHHFLDLLGKTTDKKNQEAAKQLCCLMIMYENHQERKDYQKGLSTITAWDLTCFDGFVDLISFVWTNLLKFRDRLNNFSIFGCQFWWFSMFILRTCAGKHWYQSKRNSHFDFKKSTSQTFWALQNLISMVPKNDHCWKTSHITFHNPHASNRLGRMHIMDSFCLRWFSDLPLKSILIIYIPLNFQDACQKIPPIDHVAHVPMPKMCVLALSHFIEIWQNHKGKRKVTLSF